MFTMTKAEHRQESRLRKRLTRWGYRLRKDRAHAPSFEHQGGYMILDTRSAIPVAGSGFDLTLDAAEEWLEGWSQ